MDNLQGKNRFFCLNIRDCLGSGPDQVIGEVDLKEILSDFSSPKNIDVESFLREKAVEFTKKQQSVTFLVFASSTMDLAGYFSITVKPVMIFANGLSNTAKRKLDRISKYNEKDNTYTVAAYLIAQFGKNYSESVTCPITGDELMDFAIGKLCDIQYELGGLFVYLECEDVEALLSFYQKKHGFRIFGERMTEGVENSHKLIQLMNFL